MPNNGIIHDELRSAVRGHDIILKGTPESPGGIIGDVASLKQTVRFQLKLGWLILGAVVANFFANEVRITAVAAKTESVQMSQK